MDLLLYQSRPSEIARTVCAIDVAARSSVARVSSWFSLACVWVWVCSFEVTIYVRMRQ